MNRLSFFLVIISSGLCIISCRQPATPISFYYWKTTFQLNPFEKEVLKDNQVNTLHLRYFDIDYPSGSVEPEPVSPISINISIEPYRIIPVVFIKNRVFERLNSAGVRDMAMNILSFVTQINNTHKIQANEIQFDCDWTEKTKSRYFLFIEEYRALSKNRISATIRLHQVKFHQITGIPPVDYGVLMYYNMGEINTGNTNSIYEKSVAERYNSFIQSYPLALDVALPIFIWGLQIREGKVFQLLNKMNFSHFEKDSNFISIKKNWFSVKHGCFKGGYYFQEFDLIKIENISAANLFEIVDQINRNSNHNIRNLLFYDLDSVNISQYEKDIFQKIVRRLD